MGFGLSASGFLIETLADYKEEIQTAMRAQFGPQINLREDEFLGQLIGVLSEPLAKLDQKMEAVYWSQYPDTAYGVSLDNVVAITGIRRLDATKSEGTITAIGTEATLIPEGSVVSVADEPESRFVTTEDGTIGPGINEVQTITFSAAPDAGEITFVFDGDETATLSWNNTAGDVETELENLSTIGAGNVSVTGSFATQFEVTFLNDLGGQDVPILEVGDVQTLENTSVPIDVTIAVTTPGELPNVDIPVEGETAGAFAAPAGSLTVIETVVAGWDSVTNAEDIFVGKNIETDAELRIRREKTLSAPATATLESIRSAVLEIDEVKDASVHHNPSGVTDSHGLPPWTTHVVVLGGEDEDIANALWEHVATGKPLMGDVEYNIVDSQGFLQTMRFDRPTEVDIWIEIDIETNNLFPLDGNDQIKAGLIAFADDNFLIGDDVVVFGSESIASVLSNGGISGIIDYEIRIGTAMSPTLDDNVMIERNEIADFDTSRITIGSL